MKKCMLVLLICLLPLTVFADTFTNLLRKVDQVNKSIQPAQKTLKPQLQKKTIASRYSVKLNNFRIRRSEGKTYWYVDLENHSTVKIPANFLEIRAYEYDGQNFRQLIGEPIFPRTGMSLTGKKQFGQNFIPMAGMSQIGIEVIDRSKQVELTSGMFSTDIKLTLKPVEFEAIFVKNISAQILYDMERSLFYVEVKSIGTAPVKLSDYDFVILPSMRYGKFYHSNSSLWMNNDPNEIYQTVLAPGESYRINVSTMFDSCFSGNIIHANIRHIKTGKTVNLFRNVAKSLSKRYESHSENAREGSFYFEKPSMLTMLRYNLKIPKLVYQGGSQLVSPEIDGYVVLSIGSKEKRTIRFKHLDPHGQQLGMALDGHADRNQSKYTSARFGFSLYSVVCGKRILIVRRIEREVQLKFVDI